MASVSFDQSVDLPARAEMPTRAAPIDLKVVDRSSGTFSGAETGFGFQANDIYNSNLPRLNSHQIQFLEDHFAKNARPNTNAKKQIAQELNLSLSRVNVRPLTWNYLEHWLNPQNWYQNRRAKARHQAPKYEPLPSDAASTLDFPGYHSDQELFRRQLPNVKPERLVSGLHNYCIRILDLIRQSPTKLSSSFKDLDRDLVDEQLGRLFLWGQGFNTEKLDDALDQSTELRELVLESLCEIGNLLIHSRWHKS